MGKFLFIALIPFMVCSCANQTNAPVSCAELVSSPVNFDSKSLQIEKNDGSTTNALNFYNRRGTYETYTLIMGCRIEPKRDISVIEAIGDKLEKITFKNGKVLKGNYGLTWAFWKIVTADANGTISEIEGGDGKSPNIKKITVTDRPMTANEIAAIKKMKDQAEKLRAEQQMRDQQERIEKQRKADQAAKELAAEKARLDLQRRETARQVISNKQNIGHRVCKNGSLKYSMNSGYVIMGQARYPEYSESGQAVAFLEGISPDGYKIQLRMNGWATQNGRLQYEPVGYPFLDGMNTQPGGILWDDVKDWFLCDK